MMESKRLTELDGLRGVAALVVVLYHYFYRYDELYGHAFDVPEWLRFGYYGVHLFFIISGFVIFWTISRSEKPLDFVWSRFSRLYPTFWAALTITFVAVLVFSLPGREQPVETYLLNFLMFHEFLGVRHVDGVYWTLTLELAFYFWLLVALLLGWVKYTEKALVLAVLLAGLMTSPELDHLVPVNAQKFLLFDFIELFAAGVCFYQYWSKHHNYWTHALLGLCCVAIVLDYGLAEIILLGGLFSLFVLLVTGRLRFLGRRVFVYLGASSYALYLIHQNIGYIVINHGYQLGLSPWISILGASILSLVLAHALVVWVERPSLRRMRDWYRNSTSASYLRSKLSLR